METDIHGLDTSNPAVDELQLWFVEVFSGEPGTLLAAHRIEQLHQTERGLDALNALAKLLWRPSTWSLDLNNQRALCELLQIALVNPSARDLVQLEGRRR